MRASEHRDDGETASETDLMSAPMNPRTQSLSVAVEPRRTINQETTPASASGTAAVTARRASGSTTSGRASQGQSESAFHQAASTPSYTTYSAVPTAVCRHDRNQLPLKQNVFSISCSAECSVPPFRTSPRSSGKPQHTERCGTASHVWSSRRARGKFLKANIGFQPAQNPDRKGTPLQPYLRGNSCHLVERKRKEKEQPVGQTRHGI